MAKVKITGDTKDALKKIQQLRKEVEKLDKEAKKNKTVKMSGNKGFSVGKMGGALAVAGGNILSIVIKEMLTYLPAAARLGAGLLGKSLGLKELEHAVTAVAPKIRNLAAALETFGNPAQEALERADRLDALDDEKRSHNSKSNAEEFGYSESFNNIAGVQAGQIVERVQALMDMATSGKISEMDKAWKQLQGFGVTWDEVEKGSTWNVLEKMIRAYHAAGLDGMNELEPAMQEIVGRRGISAIRKVGSAREWGQQARFLEGKFREIVPNENTILDEAAKSELIRSIAKIYGYAVPNEGLNHITNGAMNQLSEAKLKTGMVGDVETAGKALLELVDEIKNDVKPAIDEIKNYSFSDLINHWFGSEDINVNNAEINVANGEVKQVTPEEMPKQVTPEGMPKNKQNDTSFWLKAAGHGYEALNFTGNLITPHNYYKGMLEGVQKAKQKQLQGQQAKEKQTEDKNLLNAIDKLTSAINKNKDATSNLSSSMQQKTNNVNYSHFA